MNENKTMDNSLQVRLITNTIFGLGISILGIFGNIFCLLAVGYRNYQLKRFKPNHGTKQNMGNRMYIYIQYLAITDLFYLMFNIQYCIYSGHGNKEFRENEVFTSYMMSFQQPTWNAFKATSDYIVICMTIDRYR